MALANLVQPDELEQDPNVVNYNRPTGLATTMGRDNVLRYEDANPTSAIYALNDPNSLSNHAYDWGGDPNGAKDDIDRSRAQGAAADTREGPWADYSGAQGYANLGLGARGSQTDALGMYRNAAMGNGPSVAQAQLQQGLYASQAAAASRAASARGGGLAAGAAQYQAGQIAGDQTMQAANASAMIRAQEMQNAMGGYSGLANSMRTGDLASQTQAAGQSQFNTNADLQTRALNDQRSMNYEQMAHDTAARQLQASMQRQGDKAAYMGAANNQESNRLNGDQFGMKMATNVVGSVVGAGGSALAAGIKSDERVKEGVHSASADVQDTIGSLGAKGYRYSPETGEDTRPRLGVMAQDLERTPMGRNIVRDTPGGKVIDMGGATSLSLAAVADLHRRISALEGRGAR